MLVDSVRPKIPLEAFHLLHFENLYNCEDLEFVYEHQGADRKYNVLLHWFLKNDPS